MVICNPPTDSGTQLFGRKEKKTKQGLAQKLIVLEVGGLGPGIRDRETGFSAEGK